MNDLLPDIDPHAAATDPGGQQKFNELLIRQYRTNGGKVTGQFAGLPVLLPRTVGAKSGAPRTTPLVYLQDADRYLIIASKAGAPTNPAWYYNLLATPTASVEVGNERFEVQARVAHGDERDRLFQTVIAQLPIYEDYQRRTGRPLPVVVLERISPTAP